VPTGRSIPSDERLVIPSIGVNAPMVTLGVDNTGVMQVPSDGDHVGWYTFSAAPGAAGNAVISGHFDTSTSYTAVFSRLKDLKEGDKIALTSGGQETDFQVFWTKDWTDQNAPLALILGNAPSPTLTLITCAGTWDRNQQNYSDRLVVRAKLPGSI
jgi:LPXTG-site transpeptidase (sortase) family protein